MKERPVVAYNDGMGSRRVYCLACPRPEDVDVPLAPGDVETWERCPGCRRLIVDVARTYEN